MKDTVLITGSSSGIGYHLAHQFAKNGHPLILVAPVAAEIEIVAAELASKYGIAARGIAADLEKEEGAQGVFDKLHKEGLEIGILVNNAGHGFRGKSWEIPLERDLSIVKLNIEAVLRMTKLFLPPMIARGSGKILNTASVAGFEAGPMLNVYHSSKAFVLSYTEGLAVELEGTGVSVTALCPGPTDTDFFTKADMVEVVGFQKANLMAPQDVAKAGFEGLMNGDGIVIPGAANKAFVAGRRLLTEHAQAKLNEKMYQEVPPEDHKRDRGDLEGKASD